MQKYRHFLVVFWLDKICHFDNSIGGKILFRFSRKYAQNLMWILEWINEFFLTAKNRLYRIDVSCYHLIFDLPG